MKKQIRTILLFAGILCCQSLTAQRAIDFLEMQGNSGNLFLRIISESDAISAGRGVLKIALPAGITGAADLVPTSHSEASGLRIQTGYGTMSWRKESFYAKCNGGIDGERFKCIIPATGNGFTLAGYTLSYGAGSTDVYLVQTTEDGSINWGKAFGESKQDGCNSILQTDNGDYFLAGYQQDPDNWFDAYYYHLDGSGNIIHEGALGASNNNERYYDLVQAGDGHIVAIGTSAALGGSNAIFISKINHTTGAEIWSNIISSSEYYTARSIVLRPDGGFVSTGNIGTPSTLYDVCMTFISPDGNQESCIRVGGTGNEVGQAIILGSDGNYVIAGSTSSIGAGGNDFYILKRNASGDEIWSVTLGGTSSETPYGIAEANDGGYIIVGETLSFGAGNYDAWIVKIDPSGNPEWSWVFGGSSSDVFDDVYQDPNGCIYACGYTQSYGAGNNDALIVKFSQNGETCLGNTVSIATDGSGQQLKAEKTGFLSFDRTSLPSRIEGSGTSAFKVKQLKSATGNRSSISITPGTTVICND